MDHRSHIAFRRRRYCRTELSVVGQKIQAGPCGVKPHGLMGWRDQYRPIV